MKKTLTGLLLFGFFLLLPWYTVSAAGEEALFADSRPQELFTSENGLLSTSSTAIAQTTDGFIWIGGYGGLVRYDGKTFEPYLPEELTGVNALLADADGALWIAAGDRGLARYNNGTLTWITDAEGTPAVEVTALAQAPDGTVWLGTADGLSRVDAGLSVARPGLTGLQGSYIRQVLCLPDGRVLCVTRDGQLFVCAGTDCSPAELDTGEQGVRCVGYCEMEDSVYVGLSGDTVLRCSSAVEPLETLSFPELQSINEILCAEDEALWLCADNGVAVWRDEQYRIQRLKMDNSVDHIMIDTENNIWFVSSRQGVLCVSQGTFANISQSAGLNELVVNAVQCVGDRIYAGHDSGLLILDAESLEAIPDPDFDSLDGVRIRALYEDADGAFWIATGGSGLLCYRSDHTWKTYDQAHAPVIRSDKFRCMTSTESGLIAGTDCGAYTIKEDEVKYVLNDPEEMNCRILSAAVLSDGTLCLGTDGYGLYLVRDGAVVRHLTTDDGLSSNVIMKLCPGQTSEGLWMVTGSSISRLDPDGSLSDIDQIPLNNRLDFRITQDGEVLILTSSEIVRTTEAALLTDAPEYTSYRYVEMLHFEITANSNQYLLQDAMYFCGTEGIARMRLHTDADGVRTGTWQLVIDKVQTDSERQDVRSAGRCTVGADVRRIEIGAHVLTYGFQDPQVFYYLEGFDTEKTIEPLREAGAISYTNLDGGNYLFHYGIMNRDTVVQEITLPIEKMYHWYERTSVRIALTLAALAGIGLLVWRFLQVRVNRINRELRAVYEQQEKAHLKEIAYKDYLTGLYNRNYLDVWNDTMLPRAEYPISFLMTDINDLKRVNDTYGHKQGDLLLCKMADLLKAQFADDRYAVIRLGGDEFLVLCCGTDAEQAVSQAEQLRRAAAAAYIHDAPITFSYGICTLVQESFDFDEGLRRSDLNMLEDKRRQKAVN